MKKGDVIQMRKDIPAGKHLMHGFGDETSARQAMANIKQYYNLPASARLEIVNDMGVWHVEATDDTYIILEAKVNWVVDNEAGITFLDTGGTQVIDFNDEENKGWVVIESARPQFQSSVEHMSDEELRNSIEALRSNRVSRPSPIKKVRTTKISEPGLSKEEKETLGKLTPEMKMALMKKLGLV